MRAVVYRQYGAPDVLRVEDVDLAQLGDGDILVDVRAASVNPLDWHLMRGLPYAVRLATGLRRPRMTRLGSDFAGVVEATGPAVTSIRVGDRVAGQSRGTFAERVAVSTEALTTMPAELSFEQAAALPVAGFTALQGLRDSAGVRAGQQVLINGAAGGVGTLAVQIAKWMGAEVTGVCSTRNLEFIASLGADHAVDYTRDDFTRAGKRWDVIFDLAGARTLGDLRRALAVDGVLVSASAPNGNGLQILARPISSAVTSLFARQRLVMLNSTRSIADLEILLDLAARGVIHPVIDTVFPLDEIADAVRLAEAGHVRGKAVITI